MMENCSVETVKKIFRAYLDRYGSRLSDNPVLTNILNFPRRTTWAWESRSGLQRSQRRS